MTTETIQRPSTAHELNQRWASFRADHPRMGVRDAAIALEVSEAELIASGCGKTALQLGGDFSQLIEELPSLGLVMALTRSDHVVIEKTGPVERVDIYRPHRMGSIIGEAIDLRLFLDHWVYGFAVTEHTQDSPRRSLQFFDAFGSSVHKIFLTAESNLAHFAQLVTRCVLPGQRTELTVQPLQTPEQALPDAAIDVAGFREAWQAMQHTHEFFSLLKQFKVQRLQGLRLIGSDLAYPVAVDAYRQVLEAVSDIRLPIMVFVRNRGVIQIHTGTVHHLVSVGDWFNVLDLEFNFHLREAAVASTWIVRKPTADGHVTALELYDHQGKPLVQFFGQRRSGQKESTTWRQLLVDLPRWKN
jgi:putative hemin transport protein